EVELDPGVAQPGDQLPARRQLPGADQIGFPAVDGVELVTHQATLESLFVDEAAALLALIVVGDTGGQGDRQIEQSGVALPAQLTATEAAVQLDHAAAEYGLGGQAQGLGRMEKAAQQTDAGGGQGVVQPGHGTLSAYRG